jgi:hypothetical protein
MHQQHWLATPCSLHVQQHTCHQQQHGHRQHYRSASRSAADLLTLFYIRDGEVERLRGRERNSDP